MSTPPGGTHWRPDEHGLRHVPGGGGATGAELVVLARRRRERLVALEQHPRGDLAGAGAGGRHGGGDREGEDRGAARRALGFGSEEFFGGRRGGKNEGKVGEETKGGKFRVLVGVVARGRRDTILEGNGKIKYMKIEKPFFLGQLFNDCC